MLDGMTAGERMCHVQPPLRAKLHGVEGFVGARVVQNCPEMDTGAVREGM